jgi:hypothetical protein
VTANKTSFDEDVQLHIKARLGDRLYGCVADEVHQWVEALRTHQPEEPSRPDCLRIWKEGPDPQACAEWLNGLSVRMPEVVKSLEEFLNEHRDGASGTPCWRLLRAKALWAAEDWERLNSLLDRGSRDIKGALAPWLLQECPCQVSLQFSQDSRGILIGCQAECRKEADAERLQKTVSVLAPLDGKVPPKGLASVSRHLSKRWYELVRPQVTEGWKHGKEWVFQLQDQGLFFGILFRCRDTDTDDRIGLLENFTESGSYREAADRWIRKNRRLVSRLWRWLRGRNHGPQRLANRSMIDEPHLTIFETLCQRAGTNS